MSRKLLALVITAVVAGVGCAEPVEDVNRVQPLALKKTMFTGEWVYKQTISDLSPEVSLGFVGYQAGTERLVWDITRERLRGYRTHEAIRGLDSDRTADGAEFRGDPVVQCSIGAHFDIIRGYSAATGERTNSVVENQTDRPWFEREYIRVDWSSCRGADTTDLWFFPAYSQAAEIVREDEVFEPDHLQVTDDYIQVTQKMIFATSMAVCFYTYGSYDCRSGEGSRRLSFWKIPKDELGAPVHDYEPREYLDTVAVRDDDGKNLRTLWLGVPLNSPTEGKDFACTPELIEFLNGRSDVRRDYVAEDCDEVHYEQMGRHGLFRTERWAYDRRLGAAHDEHREFYANIHPIWKDPYHWVDGVKTSKPMSERLPRPVIYYLNANFPDDLLDVGGQMSNDWDTPFFQALAGATGRNVETLRGQISTETRTALGQTDELGEIGGQCDADWMFLPGDELGDQGMFQIRRNTCSPCGVETYLRRNPAMISLAEQVVGEASGDDASRIAAIYGNLKRGNIRNVCAGLRSHSQSTDAEPFVWQQLGDIRFNFLNWINERQVSGPLGYGPSSVDAETGMIWSGTANLYGASIDTYARSAADIVRAMNEDLDLNSLLTGDSYAEWLEGHNSFGNMDIEMTEEMSQDMQRRFGEFRVEEAYGDYRFANGDIDMGELQRQMEERLSDPLPGDPMYAASRGPVHEAEHRREAIKNHPAIRARMLTNENLALVKPLFELGHGHEHTAEMEDAAVNMAVDPDSLYADQHQRQKFFAESNVYMAEFLDDSVIGQALSMRGMDPDEVYRQLRREIFRAVTLHEIGHTVGMTHNFQASRDAMNYPDEFWNIRENNDSDEWDVLRLPEYRYTSIMEYGARFNSDTKGLGKYDHATIKFGYGHMTENFGKDVPVSSRLGYEVFVNGYEQIPEQLGGDYQNISNRTDVSITENVNQTKDGVLENTRKLMEDPNRPAAEYWFSKEVPYGFCEHAFLGNIQCQTWDEGARYTETAQSAIQNYWNYYVFNSYRRGRAENGFINGYFGKQARVSWYLTRFFMYYYFYQQWDIGLRNDLETAALIGLNFINQVLGTPEPGPHCLDEAKNQYVPFYMATPEVQADCNAIDIPVGTGRNHQLAYNDEHWYSIDYIGSYYDKLSMLNHLTDTSTRFWGVTNIGDSRAFAIGYYRIFGEEITKLLRDMIFAWVDDEVGESYSSYAMTDEVMPNALVAGAAFYQSPEEMDGTPQIYAPVGYNTVFQALLLSTLYNTSTYDNELDFDEYITISERGSGDARTYPEDWRVASFVHPHTGTIFEAPQVRDGRSISYEVLNRAKSFVDTVWTPARVALDANPEDGAVRGEYAAADAKLGRYLDLFSDMRLLRSVVDAGSD